MAVFVALQGFCGNAANDIQTELFKTMSLSSLYEEREKLGAAATKYLFERIAKLQKERAISLTPKVTFPQSKNNSDSTSPLTLDESVFQGQLVFNRQDLKRFSRKERAFLEEYLATYGAHILPLTLQIAYLSDVEIWVTLNVFEVVEHYLFQGIKPSLPFLCISSPRMVELLNLSSDDLRMVMPLAPTKEMAEYYLSRVPGFTEFGDEMSRFQFVEAVDVYFPYLTTQQVKESLFLFAATNPELVKYFLGKGADPQMINEDGLTVLFSFEAIDGPLLLESAKLLIDAGADVNFVEEENGNTALTYLFQGYIRGLSKKRLTVLQYLLERGADPNLGPEIYAYDVSNARYHKTPADWTEDQETEYIDNKLREVFALLFSYGLRRDKLEDDALEIACGVTISNCVNDN
jgi:hypothetical protein